MAENPFERRRATLRAELDRLGLAGALITDPNHFLYLTGFLPNKDFVSYLVMDRERSLAVTPALGVDTSGAPASADRMDFSTYANLAMADLNRYVDEYAERDQAVVTAVKAMGLAGKCLGVDWQHFWRGLGAALQLPAHDLVDVGKFLYDQRVVKDAWEQEQIGFTVRVNDAGFAATQAFLRPGVTDLQAFANAWLAMATMAGGVFDLHGEFSGGPEISGQGGASPFGQMLGAGDILTADTYPVVHGYQADTTRNFVIGEPAQWQLDLHQVLEGALARGEETIRPGVPAAELDRVVRGYLEQHGPAGAVCGHHMGHGVGIGVGKGAHYPPFIVPQSRDVLQEGNVLTLEPGLYMAGKGGMRLEDNYVVTKTGMRALGTFPKKLAICG